MVQVTSRLRQGIERLKLADAIDEVVGVVAGTMVEVSFLQIGQMPQRKGKSGSFPLRRGEWRFNGFRSVAYLQTTEQKENRFLSVQRAKLGFDAQFDLMAEYRRSKSTLEYSEWCAIKEDAHHGSA